MFFGDRTDAGRQLAARLDHLKGRDVLVLGLPRGGVPVAAEVAAALGAPLDVCLVRKLGVPRQPELAMGALGEGGVRVLNERVLRDAGVTERDLAAVEERELRELERRGRRYRGSGPSEPLAGRTVLVVDDGFATGATALAACRVVRAGGAARIVLAVPVAPRGWAARLGGEADETVSVRTPDLFFAIGQFYGDFSQTPDTEVIACLERNRAARGPVARGADDLAVRGRDDVVARRADGPVVRDGEGRTVRGTGGAAVPGGDGPVVRGTGGAGVPGGDGRVVRDGPVARDVRVPFPGGELPGRLVVPEDATGVVLFAHGSGSGRHSPRNRAVAAALNRAGLGTLLFDLLTEAEAADRALVFDAPLLAGRLSGATEWLSRDPAGAGLPLGYFGASTGAAAALWAAGDPASRVAAVVSRGGRPDLAARRLGLVRAPTLLVVGGRDARVVELNRRARSLLRCESELALVPGAGHLFEEPGALEEVAGLATSWFTGHLRDQ
ncbi:phosphoribosyltransferase family protein [Streptomyces sp. NPDC101490]|uniref:phosphoribosyltransferase family protein n=1 Tax=Streptomyces sp. NPDC101490 TaxID=3366143 RepID=UPI00381C1D26